jgi:hypothetical protein
VWSFLTTALHHRCKSTDTYLPALRDVLLTVVKEQQWEFVTDVEAAWVRHASMSRLNVPDGPHIKRLTCYVDIYDDGPYDPVDEGGLRLEVRPTGLRLSFSQFRNAAVTVACPQLILERILSGQ